ncbi:hypothetical protein M4951_14390 [Blastopirellula sp. J2-11]|uniref:hypothetical protein n=1 Tax=Blastopirellula sp. J2-11 TaxID=2943192 RepID=UPI0021C6DBA2|nr:hypothetical protein [Blastopirellula sp. J2-11]UUO04579.1 hypothetical protein M4951_14390 [Blastopirellula sp. J2-11]
MLPTWWIAYTNSSSDGLPVNLFNSISKSGRSAPMPRIVISCLAPLKPQEVRFLQVVRSVLTDHGYEFVLFSLFPYPELADSILRMPSGVRNWERVYRFQEDQADQALPYLDQEMWLQRLKTVDAAPHGQSDCLPLLRNLASVSWQLLHSLQPSVFVSWNPADPTTGIMHQMASRLGIPVSAFERGLLPGTFNIDPKVAGVHTSLVDRTWEDLCPPSKIETFQKTGESVRQAFVSQDFNRWPQVVSDETIEYLQDKAIPSEPKVLVLGCFDTVCGISASDPEREQALPGYESGYQLACMVSRKHHGTTVYKPHPHMRSYYASYDTRGERNLVIGTGDITPYWEWADVVVSYGTTLEYVALARDLPVVLAGRSSLLGKGIAYEALESDDLSTQIRAAFRREDAQARRNRFLAFSGFLADEYLVQTDTEETRRSGAERWFSELQRSALSVEPDKPLAEVRRQILNSRKLKSVDLRQRIYSEVAKRPMLREMAQMTIAMLNRLQNLRLPSLK